VDAVLYSLQIVLGVLVCISVRLDGLPSLYVLGVTYIIGLVFCAVVHFKNRAENKAKSIILPPLPN
jgi:uncharacterized membrane protein HdeD (DUF308 family)